MNKEELEKSVNEKLSLKEMSIIFKCSKSKIRYWLNQHSLKSDGYKKNYTWDEDSLKNAVLNSSCKSDVLRILDVSLKSGNFQTLDRYILKYKIDASNLIYDNKRGSKFIKIYENEDVFCENSEMSTKNIKNRVIKQNLINYVCSECGIVDNWNGKEIILQLDHINGINNDNRIENLRFLCPNCHSQTSTYCSKKGTIV